MVKNHLKRIAAPNSWRIGRKENVFVAKPNPGAHSLAFGIPFVVIIRDILVFAKTMKEVRDIIHNQKTLVDGNKVTNHKQIVGLMDVITLNDKHYRVVMDAAGKISAVEIKADEAAKKISKITGKTSVGKKIQLNLFDGKNILVEKADQKVGDSVVVELPSQKIADTIKFEKGASILLTGGRHVGVIGTVESVDADHLVFKDDKNNTFETIKKHAYVLGKGKPAVQIQ